MPDVPGPTCKISEALLSFAEPLTDLLQPDPRPTDFEHHLKLAQLVWNAVVLDVLGHASPYLAQARESIDTSMTDPARSAMLELIGELERRKRRQTPSDLRLIRDVEVLRSASGGQTCVVCSEIAPPPAPKQLNASPARLSPRRGPEAFVNSAARASWAELYAVATTFLAVAPWRWLSDEQIFGVRDPASGEVGWCCVMGAAGQIAGLAVYRGDAGFDHHRRTQSDESEEDEAAFGQDALVLAFVDRAVLSKEALRRFRDLGLTFRGCEWPDVDSHAAGRLPMPPNDAEVERMIVTVRQATEVATSARNDAARIGPDERGRLLVRLSTAGPAGLAWADERVEPPKPMAVAVPAFNAARAARIRLQARPSDLCLECDVFPMHTSIRERGRDPFAPAVFLLADAQSGAIVHMQVGDGQDRARMAQDELCKAIDALGALPAELRVRRRSVANALADLARAIGVPLAIVDSLAALEEARATLNQFTERGGGTRRPRR